MYEISANGTEKSISKDKFNEKISFTGKLLLTNIIKGIWIYSYYSQKTINLDKVLSYLIMKIVANHIKIALKVQILN